MADERGWSYVRLSEAQKRDREHPSNGWSYVGWSNACERHRQSPDDEWQVSLDGSWVPWDGVAGYDLRKYRHRPRVKAPLDFRGAMRAMLEGKVVECSAGWRYRIDDNGLRGKAPSADWHGLFLPSGMIGPFTVVEPEWIDVPAVDALQEHAAHPDDEWEHRHPTQLEWFPWTGDVAVAKCLYRRRGRT